MFQARSHTPVEKSAAPWLLLAPVLCVAMAGPVSSQDAEERPSGAELEKRRQALSSWVFEPVELDGSSFRLRMDRHNSSFSLSIRRSNIEYYSSWGRKGFCSLHLSDGRTVPVDKVENLVANSERIRFRAASSTGQVPAVWIEWRNIKARNTLSLVFEVPQESREQVAGFASWTGPSG